MTTLDPQRLIFLDESGIVQGMRLAYGYAPQGQRCYESAPFRVGRRTSLVGFLSSSVGRVLAFEGTVTAEVFERFVSVCLVPHLRVGDVVVWDNARIHSGEAVRLVEQAGARVLPLPRYSPEYNAIEQFWSKVKHLVRTACADTGEALAEALAWAVSCVRSEDVAGWIRHCGYTGQPSSA